VPLLVAIDGAPWNSGGGVSAWNPLYYWKLACNLPRWLADDLLKSRSFWALLRRLRNKLNVLPKLAMSAVQGERSRYGHMVAGFMDITGLPEAQVSFMKALFNALYEYTPQKYTGPVLVYAAKTQPLYHLFQFEAVWLLSRTIFANGWPNFISEPGQSTRYRDQSSLITSASRKRRVFNTLWNLDSVCEIRSTESFTELA
jgi:hypothetical protein